MSYLCRWGGPRVPFWQSQSRLLRISSKGIRRTWPPTQVFLGELVFRPSPQNLCLRNRILLQQHVANNQIGRNLCDLLRRQNSVAQTKIFTKIFQYTRSHVSLACVASLSVWFWRKERPRNGIFGFGRARNGTTANLRTVFDSRSEIAQKRWLGRLCGDATCCCN